MMVHRPTLAKQLRGRIREFNFTTWLASRARRLRIYRAIANIFWPSVAGILIVNLIRWALPPVGTALELLLGVPFAIAIGLLMIPWLLINWSFMFGLIKCPSCDSRFAPRITVGWIPRTCQSCRFDIYTLDHDSG
jgi:hypothetical protein